MKRKFESFHEEELCAITLKPLSQLNKVTRLKCGHQFCSESIYLWFKKSDLCPLCRSKISDTPHFEKPNQVEIIDLENDFHSSARETFLPSVFHEPPSDSESSYSSSMEEYDYEDEYSTDDDEGEFDDDDDYNDEDSDKTSDYFY